MDPSGSGGGGSNGKGGASSSIMDLGRSLLEAAREGNTERVYEYMSKGAPFTTDWLGTSPLHLAAKNNHVDTCQVLLRGGLNKDTKTKVDRTPLHFAVTECHAKVVELLLSHKCNPNAADMLKMTPLHWAVEKEDLAIVEMLLLAGADPNLKSKFGKTPISLAVEKQNREIFAKLVDPTKLISNVVQTETATKKLAKEVSRPVTKQEDEVIIEDIIESDAEDSVEEDNVSTIGDAFMQLPDTESSTQTTAAGMELLKEHGIQLMKVDDSSSVLQSAIDTGRRLILSEAGKYILRNAINQNLLPTPDKANTHALARPKLNVLPRRSVKKVVHLSSSEYKSMFVTPAPNTATTGSPTRRKRDQSTPTSPANQSMSPPAAKQAKATPKTIPEISKLPQSTTVTVQDRRTSTSTTRTNKQQASPSQIQHHQSLQPDDNEVIDLDEVLPTINGTNCEREPITLPDLDKQVQELRKETGDLRKQLEISQKQNQDYQRRLEKLETIILSFHRQQSIT